MDAYTWSKDEEGKEFIKLWTGEIVNFTRLADVKIYISGFEKALRYNARDRKKENDD